MTRAAARSGWVRLRWLAVAALLTLTGCALRYTDARGQLTTVGFVWQTVPTATKHTTQTSAAETTRVRLAFRPETLPETPLALRQRALGLIVDFTSRRQSLALGWQDLLLVFPAEEGLSELTYDSARPLDARLRLRR